MMLRRVLLPSAAAILLAALLAPGPAGGQDGPSAAATAYSRASDGGRKAGLVRVSGDGERSARGTLARASTGGTPSARASARVKDVSLFGGLVTARLVSVAVSASPDGPRRSGKVVGLRIEGERRRVPERGRTFDLNGHGTLIALRRGSGSITGLRAKLSEDYGEHERGDAVTIAYASAAAEAGPPPAEEPEAEEPEEPAERDEPEEKPEKREPTRVEKLIRGDDYEFPVQGNYRYRDDYGAPRQFTGTHVGNDIFAPAGTPIVAVADGELFKVGTRRISGNRFWLKSKAGDKFFYAHLASFAENARNGVEVEAGDVVGYVGSTGDAEQTPPHLHFEIHPGGHGPVNPFEILRAWDDGGGGGAEASPGALVVVEDYLAR